MDIAVARPTIQLKLGDHAGIAKLDQTMADQSFSAFAAVRALRDELRARLDENEDYRAWKVLDEAVRRLDPPTMPKAVELAISAIGAAADHKAMDRADDARLSLVMPSRENDVALNFATRA
jgi:hypothetical protein